MEKSKALLSLIRLGLGHDGGIQETEFDWPVIKALAEQHGLSAVVLDGIERLKSLNVQDVQKIQEPPKVFLLEWIGETLQDYEYRYEQCRKAIAELVGFYNGHGYKMMVVKGYACSLDWPKPEHRPCGDIDIWLFGKQKEADKLLESSEFSVESVETVEKVKNVKKIEIDKSHHHHTVFYWRDFMVENHYDFINVHSRKPNIELEKIFKELGKDDSHYIELNGEKLYLPSPNLHVLFLMRHLVAHFTSVSITLRQVLDWAFFVEKHGKDVDWEWLLDILEQYGMIKLFNIFNAICVEDLGFNASIFPTVQFLPALKDRVLSDIMSPEFNEQEEGNIIRRYILKYRRWQANKWKHDLCFNDSRWSAFWTGVWGHLSKPKSI